MTSPDLHRLVADVLEREERLLARVAELEAENKQLKARVQGEQKVWFTVREAAAFIGKSKSFLDLDRIKTVPVIPFIKHSPKCVRYNREDLDRYLKGCKKSRS